MLTELQIETIVAETCGTYRTGDSYTFEDVWNCIEKALAAHSAGAQETVGEWVLVKRERLADIKRYANAEFVNSYRGQNLYDERSLMQNERIGEEALSNIRYELQCLEEDEKDRIAAHPQPQPQTDAARDAKDAKRYRLLRERDFVCADNPNASAYHCVGIFTSWLPAATIGRDGLDAVLDAEIERLDRTKGE